MHAHTRSARFEVVLWAVLVLALASAMLAGRPLPLSNDSYRYLNAAAQVREGRGPASTVAYYDLERAHGHLPYPLTHWPPGYPATIAATSAFTSGDLERAARIVSALACAGTAALLTWALQLTGVSPLVRGVMLTIFAFNVTTLSFATAVLSEALFTCATMGTFAALLWAEGAATSNRPHTGRAAGAAALAGLTYWLRYAGLFVVAGVVTHAALRWALHPSRRSARTLRLMALPLGLVATLAGRNAWLTGNWRGGNEMPTAHPLSSVLREYVSDQVHVLFGLHAFTFGAWEWLLALGTLGAVLTLALGCPWPRPRRHVDWWKAWCGQESAAPLMVGVCVVIYTAGMLYAGSRTVVSFDPRMFLPLFPLYLVLAGVGVSRLKAAMPAARHHAFLTACLLLVCVAYAGVNARDLSAMSRSGSQDVLVAAWAKPAADGQPLRSWIDAHVPPAETVFAGDAQATAYILRRPMVGLVTAEYSPVRWECDSIKRELSRFHARFVVVYTSRNRALGDSLALLSDSPFVAAAVDGPPPCGCSVAAENPDIRILSCPEFN